MNWKTSLIIGLVAILSGCAQQPPSAPPPTRPNIDCMNSTSYRVNGALYVAQPDGYDRTGVASWYGPGFHGRQTASGQTFDQTALTAAHPTLPLSSVVTVTNLDNGRSVAVTVNDRGGFAADRIIDLSKAAAHKLGFEEQGTARVRVQSLEKASVKPWGAC